MMTWIVVDTEEFLPCGCFFQAQFLGPGYFLIGHEQLRNVVLHFETLLLLSHFLFQGI